MDPTIEAEIDADIKFLFEVEDLRRTMIPGPWPVALPGKPV